jgi:hypothetical protein
MARPRRCPEIEHAITIKRAQLEVYESEQKRLLLMQLDVMREIEDLEEALISRSEDAVDLAFVSALAGQPVAEFAAD